VSIKFRFVCATRETREQFFKVSALGRSLALFPYSFTELRLFPENRTGLPALYNQALREAAADPAVLIFIHDDVLLCDLFWPNNLIDGLSAFDVIGLAGNRRRVPRQPAWGFIDDKFTWDQPQNLSGIVCHGTGFPPQDLSFYGSPRQEVKLLDGLLLAAHSETLVSKGVGFDERFDFHFYDLDFCRQAESKGLRMGTWSISAIHESGGAFNTPAWQAAYAKYLEKWQS
jgi:hypothetical protein